MKTRDLARLALLTAAALALGYAESLLPPLVPAVPGIRLGLANTAVLCAVYLLGGRRAAALVAAKVLLSALTYAGFGAGLYSLAGGAASLAAMLAVRRLWGSEVSVLGVSVVGAAFHNLGQSAVFALVAGPRTALVYLPWLLVAAVASGLATGLAARYVIRVLKRLRGWE